MKRDSFRSVGACFGLALGVALMYAVGLSGVLQMGICGAVGAVAGGITGEKIYDSRNTEN